MRKGAHFVLEVLGYFLPSPPFWYSNELQCKDVTNNSVNFRLVLLDKNYQVAAGVELQAWAVRPNLFVNYFY